MKGARPSLPGKTKAKRGDKVPRSWGFLFRWPGKKKEGGRAGRGAAREIIAAPKGNARKKKERRKNQN